MYTYSSLTISALYSILSNINTFFTRTSENHNTKVGHEKISHDNDNGIN